MSQLEQKDVKAQLAAIRSNGVGRFMSLKREFRYELHQPGEI